MGKEERILKFTLKQAKNNDTLLHHKHAAVVAKGSWIISLGYNHWKSQDNSVHAEVHAIRCALRIMPNLQGCTIYVARHCKSKVGLSRPCDECMDAIYKAGIKDIIYTESYPHGEGMRYTRMQLKLIGRRI